jgi:hypothetical protein
MRLVRLVRGRGGGGGTAHTAYNGRVRRQSGPLGSKVSLLVQRGGSAAPAAYEVERKISVEDPVSAQLVETKQGRKVRDFTLLTLHFPPATVAPTRLLAALAWNGSPFFRLPSRPAGFFLAPPSRLGRSAPVAHGHPS